MTRHGAILQLGSEPVLNKDEGAGHHPAITAPVVSYFLRFWSLSEVESKADGGVYVQLDVRRKVENGYELEKQVEGLIFK